MPTFEVETIHYNPQGGIRTKECDLFDSKNKAVDRMREIVRSNQGLQQQGKVRDGQVTFIDDRGNVRHLIKIGQIV